MGISATAAAVIARRHGLTLTDATALRMLADTVAEAERLAALFPDRDQTTHTTLAPA